ncbi:MAG: DUF2283 domain-containing protein [Candidatus Eremiobacteraeota bacterium]|nr:DUF2283 domain-containing protein [Candidatus Eremiobacteraeota bacterium]
MKPLIAVDVDPAIPAAYLRYRKGEVDRTVEVTADCSVAVDVDDAGVPLGIEILNFDDPDVVDAARSYAREHDLAFPRDLSGVLATWR